MGSVPSRRGRSLLPFRLIPRVFAYTLIGLSAAAAPAAGQTGGLKVHIDRITIDTLTTLGGKRADFPSPVMSILTVRDRQNRYVHGLADTTRWLSAGDVNQLGQPVSQAWPTILETHVDDPAKPRNPDVTATTPGFQVREMRLDMGLSVAMVMDYSGSMIGRFDSVKTAAKVFIRQMQSKDRVAIWKFAKKSFLMQDFTSDTTALMKAIDTDTSDWAGTYFYDALWTALKATEGQPERRVVIAYTDGRDHNKGYTIDNVLDLARADSIPIYPIGLSNNNPDGGGPQLDKLQQIAYVTGGMSYFAPSIDSLGPIYREIYGHISGYYVLAHTSPDPFTNGKKRALDLTLRYDQVMGSTTTVYTGRDTAHYAVPFIPPNVTPRLSVVTPYAAPAGTTPYAVAGDTVTYRMTVRNTGRGPAAETVVALSLHDSLAYVSASPPPDSVRGGTAFWSYYYIGRRDSTVLSCRAVLPPRMPAGDTRVTSAVSVTCLDDSIPTDNAASADFFAAARPNFTVRVRPVTATVTPAYPWPVEVVVRNDGNADRTSAFGVTLDGVPPWPAPLTNTIPGLAMGDSAVTTFTPSFRPAGDHVIAAVADPLAAVAELDETDNADTSTVAVGVTALASRLSDFTTSETLRGRNAWFPGRVIASVSLMDQNGHPVTGLADSDEWAGLEDSNELGNPVGSVWAALSEAHEENPAYPPQKDVRPGLSVTEFSASPISAAVVFDRSAGSQDTRSDLSAFFGRFSRSDHGAVIAFNDGVRTLQPLTSDAAALQAAVNGAPASGSGRRLADAVASAIEALAGASGRSGVIAVTSGNDAGSAAGIAGTVRLSRERGVPVHVIVCGGTPVTPEIDSLAAGSGGWTLAASSGGSGPSFAEALLSAEEALRNYYGLAFASSDTTQDRTWRRVGLRVEAYGLAAPDTGIYRAPQGAANVAVRVFSKGTSFTVSGGDTTWFVRTGEKVRVSVALLNIGHQDVSGVRLTDSLPATLVPDSVAFSHASAGDSLSWICDSLPIRAVRNYVYTLRADTLFALQNTALTHTVRAWCGPDTSLRDNAATNTVVYIPLLPPDFAVNVEGVGDSLAVAGGDSVWYTRAGGEVRVTVTVTNRGELACPAISMTGVLPPELTLTSFSGSAYEQRGDSLFWFIDELQSRGGSRSVTFTCDVDTFLPPWEVLLINRAWGHSDSETITWNNADADTVIVAALIPPDPSVEAYPSTVEPGDSVSVRVVTPVTVASWDLEVFYETGESHPDYADAFIAANPDLPRGAWTLVAPPVSDTRMRTARESERVGVVFTTVDLWNVTRSDTAFFTIRSSDAFVLGDNVFQPASGGLLELRFKLSSNRRADLSVYDASGAFIRNVASGAFPAGWNTAWWDGTDANGRRAGSGVYLAVANSGGLHKALKFILVR